MTENKVREDEMQRENNVKVNKYQMHWIIRIEAKKKFTTCRGL